MDVQAHTTRALLDGLLLNHPLSFISVTLNTNLFASIGRDSGYTTCDDGCIPTGSVCFPRRVEIFVLYVFLRLRLALGLAAKRIVTQVTIA